MGWSNYVVLPKYKIAFEVSRYIDDMSTSKELETQLDEAIIMAKNIELDVSYCNLTISKLADLVTVTKSLQYINDFYLSNLGICFLKKYDKDIYIIDENKAHALADTDGYTLIYIDYEGMDDK